MNWMTFIWPMVTAACLTLAVIHLRIALGEGRRAVHLFFAASALSVATISVMELVLFQMDDLGRYQVVLRWAAVPLAIMIASVTGFVRTFFETGRLWLAILGVATHASSQVANLLTTVPAVRQAVALRQIETIGQARFTLPTVINGPWAIVELIGILLVVAFVFEASAELWQGGARRRAVIVGGSVIFFFLVARGHALLVERGILEAPYFVSFAFLAVLIAMGHELSEDALQAVKLARELSESERHIELAARAATLGFWAWDVQRDDIWASESARVLFGVARDERINLRRFLDTLHPEDRASVREAIAASLDQGLGYEKEYRVVIPGGGSRWIAASGRVERGRAGQALRLRGVVMDISRRRGSEEENQASAIKIQQQRDELSHLSRVALLGEISGSLAHELGQPLGAILANAQAARRWLAGDPPNVVEARAAIEDLIRDDKRAGEIVHRVRGLAKKEAAASVLLDVNQVVRETSALLRSELIAADVPLTLELQPELPVVKIGHVELQQSLLNLMLNGLQAQQETENSRRGLTVTTRPADGNVIMAVRDRGPGLSPEIAGRIFDAFFTTKPGGLGLGLAFCRRIAETHGGRLWAENHPDGGAVFLLALPAQPGASA